MPDPIQVQIDRHNRSKEAACSENLPNPLMILQGCRPQTNRQIDKNNENVLAKQ